MGLVGGGNELVLFVHQDENSPTLYPKLFFCSCYLERKILELLGPVVVFQPLCRSCKLLAA